MGQNDAQAVDKAGDTGFTVVNENQTLVDEIKFAEGFDKMHHET